MINKQHMPGDDFVENLLMFATDLRWVRRLAGDPPYRKLSRQLKYSPATITRNLGGNKLPSWEFVRGFLQACDVDIATIDEVWKARWIVLANHVDPIGDRNMPEPAHAAPQAVPAGTGCAECGAWVVDLETHARWHQERTPRRSGTSASVRRIAG
ncbi:helix-turn-helix domain-containing protein [Amycolatopsis pigmentata]|uniref:Helix-turn-helix domain-containing protein n=1 Tax=Amycolatopsis pigmentata TaxID=450801 RepID=A0ABW5FXM4_9PSEU